jgi:hypothetical protein
MGTERVDKFGSRRFRSERSFHSPLLSKPLVLPFSREYSVAFTSMKALIRERVLESTAESEEGAPSGGAVPSAGSNSVQDALKRKEGLLRAHQARLEKLEAQNEALRDDLKREEHRRRDAEDRAEQAQRELQAFVNMPAQSPQPQEAPKLTKKDTFAEHGSTSEAEFLQRIVDLREKIQQLEERKDALYSEMQVQRGVLEETKEKLEKSVEAKAELATKLEEATAKLKEAGGAAPAEAKPAAAPESQPDKRPRKPSDREMEALLPAEAYRAMQDTRAESSRRIAELEEQVAALKSIDGEAARMREKAAHQSMAERCAKVSQNLRVVEGQLERTQALLNPTKVQLLRLQKEHLELKSSYAELKKEAEREMRLRTAMASMALIGYCACYDAVMEVASLRAHLPPMPQDSGFGSTSNNVPPPPPPQNLEEHGDAPARPSSRESSRPATRESTRGSTRQDHKGAIGIMIEPATIASLEEHAGSIDVMLQNAVLRIDELAPFNSPPAPYKPLTSLQQLYLLANQLPPPNPLPSLPPLRSLSTPAEGPLAPLRAEAVRTQSVLKEYRPPTQTPTKSASHPRLPSRCSGAQSTEETSASSGALELPPAFSSSPLVPRTKGSIPSGNGPVQGFVVSGTLHGGVQGAVVYNHLEPHHKVSSSHRTGQSRQSKEQGATEVFEPPRAAQQPLPAMREQAHSHHRPNTTPASAPNHPIKIQELLMAPYVKPSLQPEAPLSVPSHWGRHHTGRWGDPPAASGARARSDAASPMRTMAASPSMRTGSLHASPSHPLGFVAGLPPPAVFRGADSQPAAIRSPG